MIKTKYTAGFEKFWRTWRGVTGKVTDKPEAFKYWKQQKPTTKKQKKSLVNLLVLMMFNTLFLRKDRENDVADNRNSNHCFMRFGHLGHCSEMIQ